MSVDVTGPDGNDYQFPDGTDKGAAIKYFRAKGIGKKSEDTSEGYKVPPSPTLAGLGAGEKKDQPAASSVDRSPRATMGRVFDQIKSDINSLPSTIDRFVKDVGTATAPPGKQSFGPLAEDVKGALGGLYQVTPGIPGVDVAGKHGFIDTLRKKEDVAPTIAGAAELTVPGALMHEPGAPETKAKPTEIPDRPPAPAVPKALEGPLSPEQQEGYTKAIDKANKEHAQALSDYAKQIEKVQKAKGTKTTPFSEAGPAKSAAAREAAINRQAVLKRGSDAYMTKAQENIAATHKAVRASLDTRWENWRDSMAGAQVPAVDVYEVAKDAQDSLRGAPASLKQFNDLMRETGLKVGDDGEIQMPDPEASDLMDIETARVHSNAIGDRLAAGGLPGNVYQALKAAREGMEGIIEGEAEARGTDAVYRDLKRDWHQYMDDWKDVSTGGSALARTMRGDSPHFVSDQVLGKEGSDLLKTLGKYRKFGGNPGLAAAARRLANEAADLKIPAERATPKMPTKPTLEAPERPKPKTPPETKAVPPKLARGAARLAGKVVGGTAGSAVGHPLLGYGAGGEAGSALFDAWWEKWRKNRPSPRP